jgi:hypothetical protein
VIEIQGGERGLDQFEGEQDGSFDQQEDREENRQVRCEGEEGSAGEGEQGEGAVRLVHFSHKSPEGWGG